MNRNFQDQARNQSWTWRSKSLCRFLTDSGAGLHVFFFRQLLRCFGLEIIIEFRKKIGKPSLHVVAQNLSRMNVQFKGNRVLSQSRLIPKVMLPKVTYF